MFTAKRAKHAVYLPLEGMLYEVRVVAEADYQTASRNMYQTFIGRRCREHSGEKFRNCSCLINCIHS
jgi:hypothetical protein